MALTRITKGVIKPNENYDTHNINSTGIVTAIGLDVNGNGDISGNLNVGGVLTYEDVTSIDSVGIITAQKDIHVGAGISAVGIGTFGGLDINGDIDVDGHTNLDNVSISGVTTFASNVHLGDNDKLIIGDHSDIQIYNDGTKSVIENGGYSLGGNNNSLHIYSLNDILHNSTYSQYFHCGAANKNVNSPRQLALIRNEGVKAYYNDNLKLETSPNGVDITGGLTVSGIATFTGAIDANGDIDVDGHTNLDNVTITGVTTANGIVNISNGDLRLTSTDAGSAAAPIIRLVRESASPADNDTLGQINFTGENDASEPINYAKIRGKILDASDGTEDGIIEYSHIKAGTEVITSRFRSDSLQLLNDTNFTVSGDSTLTGDLDVDGHTNLDNVSITGVTTANQLKFGDSNGSTTNIAKFGASDDLVIYHNGNHSKIIDMGTGNLYLESDVGSIYLRVSDNEQGVTIHQDGAVELYHDNTKRLETTSSGVEIPQALFVGEKIDMPDHTSGTNGMILLGTGDDLYMYHDGTNSHLRNNTGTFNVRATNFRLTDAAIQHVYLKTNDSGNNDVQLYYDNSKKFETTSNGVKVTGTGLALNVDGGYIRSVGGGPTVVAHKSSSTFCHIGVENNTNARAFLAYTNDKDFIIGRRTAYTGDHTGYSGRDISIDKTNHAVELCYNGGTRFATTNEGATFSTGSTSCVVRLTSNNSSEHVLQAYNNDLNIKAPSSGGISLITNGSSERLRIESSGQVKFKGGEGGTDAIRVESEGQGAAIHISNFQGITDTGDTTRLGVGKNDNALIFINAQPSSDQVQNFAIGTSDATPLVLSTNNLARLRIKSTGVIEAKTLAGSYYPIASARDGSTSARAATSAWEIKKTLGPRARNGYYYLINPYDGTTNTWWCDMTTDGGGWILIAHTGEGTMADQGAGGDHWYSRNNKGGFNSIGSGYYTGGGYWRATNGAWAENTCGQLMWDVRTHQTYYDNYANSKVVFNWNTDQALPSGTSNYGNIPNAGNRKFNDWCYEVVGAPGFNPSNYHQNARNNTINGGNYFTEHMVMTWSFRGTGGGDDDGESGPYWMIGAHANGRHQHYEESISGDSTGNGKYQVVSNEDTAWGNGGDNSGYPRLARISNNGTCNVWLR